MTAPARLSPRDVFRVGATGLRTRPLRALLSALGIAIGIAAMLSVIGLAASSTENINRQLAKFGTNVLKVTPGDTFTGGPAHLPTDAVGMIGRIGPVTSATATGLVSDAHVYRTALIPPEQTSSVAVLAARIDLLGAVGATVASGTWLNEATSRFPVVVLGSGAANRLGIGRASIDTRIWLAGQWFTVIGVLDPAPPAPELDNAALIGWQIATAQLHFDGYPTTIYTRVRDDAVVAVRRILAATANPEHPDQVNVSRPSDVLKAQAATGAGLTALLVGLGGVALLVGGIGVANTMIISVLERRSEIGLRRSLGATRGQIRLQFLTESLLLSALGGIGGAVLGIAVTAGFAAHQHWTAVLPAWATGGGLLATLLIGGCAGIYPASRASRLPPTEALLSR